MKRMFLIMLSIFFNTLLFSVMPIPDALFLDQDLNFWCLKEFFTTNDKIVVYIFSFDEPMWEHDVLSIKQQVGNTIPLVCISTDKEFYKYVSTEFFKKNKINLLFDPKGYNVKLNFGKEKKLGVVNKNMVYTEINDFVQLGDQLKKQYKNDENWSIINFVITCGLSGVVTPCASCPQTYNIGGWLQRESTLSAYKSKLYSYIFDLGNFLPQDVKNEDIKKIVYSMILTNYDKIMLGEKEISKITDIFSIVQKENQYKKFVLPLTDVYNNHSDNNVWYNNFDYFTICYLSYGTTKKNCVKEIKQVIEKNKIKNMFLFSNLGYLNDIEILQQIPEIKLVISGNHNYNLPQMMKYNDIPIIFSYVSPEYITRICLYVAEKEVKKVKVSLIPVLPAVKINTDLEKVLEEKLLK
jgi:hypothetical protein